VRALYQYKCDGVGSGIIELSQCESVLLYQYPISSSTVLYELYRSARMKRQAASMPQDLLSASSQRNSFEN
jgi:hypothetical protein